MGNLILCQPAAGCFNNNDDDEGGEDDDGGEDYDGGEDDGGGEDDDGDSWCLQSICYQRLFWTDRWIKSALALEFFMWGTLHSIICRCLFIPVFRMKMYLN